MKRIVSVATAALFVFTFGAALAFAGDVLLVPSGSKGSKSSGTGGSSKSDKSDTGSSSSSSDRSSSRSPFPGGRRWNL